MAEALEVDRSSSGLVAAGSTLGLVEVDFSSLVALAAAMPKTFSSRPIQALFL